MRTLIPHSRPTLPSESEWSQVTSSLAAGWAADGPCLAAFERRLAPWLGGEGAVAVSSGTTALQLALMAVGIRAGDEVLIPAYSCAALLSTVAAAGGTPVLVDAEPDGFNLSLEDAARRITPRTRAIVVCHLFGHPAPVEAFRQLGIPVVEDCAQSLGACSDGQLTGSRGDLAMCSFYATKVITTGQGGAVAGSGEMLERVRDLVAYDNREDWKPRLSCRMGELPAALGLWQLERLPQFLERRRAIGAYYDRELADWKPGGAFSAEAAHYRYILRTPDADAAIAALNKQGIEAKRPVFRPLSAYLAQEMPEARRCHDTLVSLPIYPSLSDAEVEVVAAAAATTILRPSAAPTAARLHPSLSRRRVPAQK